MKGVGYTFKGMEDIAAQEVFDIIGKKSDIKERCVVFEAKREDLCRLCYFGQSFIKILAVVDEFKIENYQDGIKKCDLNEWMKEDMTFAARVITVQEVDEERSEIEADIGEGIIENKRISFEPKVDLNDPDISFVGIVHDKFYLCVDFSGADLSKRDYRIFTHPTALKATIAYAMLRIADLKEDDVVLDPFCGSGTIAIEAVYYLSKKSVNFFNKDKFAFLRFMNFDFDQEDAKIEKIKGKIYSYDSQMRHIRAAEKNAKIGGVNSSINFSRTEVDWLDTKFGKSSVDNIITHPSQMSKLTNQSELAKTYDELFYQADYVLKLGGRIVVISTEGRIDDMLKKSASKKDFKLKESKEIMHGQQKEHVLVFFK